jgi:hypothetical protein
LSAKEAKRGFNYFPLFYNADGERLQHFAAAAASRFNQSVAAYKLYIAFIAHTFIFISISTDALLGGEMEKRVSFALSSLHPNGTEIAAYAMCYLY